jgi:glucose-1-phosphate adenylyltransferase
MYSMQEMLAIILGGGNGSRLFPLTEQRSKPAVTIAGKYLLTAPYHLACTMLERSSLENVLLAEGSCVKDAKIRHSIVGPRSQICSGAVIVDSILMGADYYDSSIDSGAQPEISLEIGRNAIISGAIIDKNACVGENAVILPFPRGTEINGDHWMVRDGIVVIPKNSSVKPGSYIGPENGNLFSGNHNVQAEGILALL